MTDRLFSQVDVFSTTALGGNPVAVVHDADGLDETRMAAFARWTNLSETTFLLPPTDPAADYRLRIFTPGGELPFAGHPTLGSARAWLAGGGRPRREGTLLQECGVGLVEIRVDGDLLAFAAPPLRRSGPVDDATAAAVVAALGLGGAPGTVAEIAWLDNGPAWIGVRLRDADSVLALRPDFAAMGDLKVGVIGPYAGAHRPGPAAGATGADFEVRAFAPGIGVPEDPVTGSLNAGFGVWLIGAGLAPTSYVVAQGTVLGRSGRVHVSADPATDGSRDGQVWIGGAARVLIGGTLHDLG